MAPKQDRRKERTEKEILNGLIALMQEKSMKNISVRELAERIDINRSTFYLHYTDIYDLIGKNRKSTGGTDFIRSSRRERIPGAAIF